MVDELYRNRRLVDLYDALNPWGADCDFYVDVTAPAGASLLDLGCGTGLLAAALAHRGRRPAAAVDPSARMLDTARRRPYGDQVEWLLGDARRIRLGRRFDRIISTGHAFQVFLTDADQRAFLRSVAAHLAGGGRFAFETRNPGARAWRRWNAEESRRRVAHPVHGEVEICQEASEPTADGVVSLTTTYRFLDQGQTQRSSSRLRFTDLDSLTARIEESGLKVLDVYGSWDRSPFRPDSEEIIVVGAPA